MQPPHSYSTQRSKILTLLIAAKGGEVPLPAIKALSAQYNARIYELRRAGFRIAPPRIETVNGQRHTWYRLPPTEPASQPQPVVIHDSLTSEKSLFGDLVAGMEYPD